MSSKKYEHSFWDIDQYRIIIERIENGFKSCDDFMSMIQERAELEVQYAKKLRRWEEKWTTNVLKKGYEYGSTLEALCSCIQEAGHRANLHEQCQKRLLGDEGPFSFMQKWKKSHCHKTIFSGVQEIRKFEEEFSDAQSGYMRLLSKIRKAKKAYHMAIISAHKANKFAEEESKKEGIGTETKNKLYKRAEQFAKHRDSAKEFYLKGILMCNGNIKNKYYKKMLAQFDKCQLLEKERLGTLKEEMLKFVNALDISALPGYEDVYQKIKSTVALANAADDVQTWSDTHGGTLTPYWPVFEDIDVNHLDSDKINMLLKNGGKDEDQWYNIFQSDFEEQDSVDKSWKDYVTKHLIETDRKRVSQNLAISAVQQRLLSLAHQKATQPSVTSTQRSQSTSDAKPPVDHQDVPSPVTSHVFEQHSSSHWSTDTSGSKINSAHTNHSHDQRSWLPNSRSCVVHSSEARDQFRRTVSRETGSDIPGKNSLNKINDDVAKKTKSYRSFHIISLPSDQTEHNVQALWNFEPGQHDELALQRGEVFSQIGPTNDDGWAYGRIGSKIGLFPAGYVRILKPHSEDHLSNVNIVTSTLSNNISSIAHLM
ncbi:protein kinase C and casein kinase substrate in neurons protein 3-like [Antedon mediterranea]|uniref:protein kinase C and casein kinase substrate in neurons protein 3-like n=1 Tax=Antedon mediterranea TaxID=105859 RepID=UPI003AF50622